VAVRVAQRILAMAAALTQPQDRRPEHAVAGRSHAELQRTLDRLGTNLLTASPGRTFTGGEAKLPERSIDMAGRIAPVESATGTGKVTAYVYRNDHIPAAETGSINVKAARLDLLDTVGGSLARGNWLNAATAKYPAVVLGSGAADRLGIGEVGPDIRVWLGGQWFSVVGILDEALLAPELNDSALVGWDAAKRYLGFDGHPTTIYVRTADSAVTSVRDVLAAKGATDKAFTGLMLGLGGVALLVGGVGVANTMVISVLERRAEIGPRRALGARRGDIRTQFLAESQLLAGLGGIAGVVIGVDVTTAYAVAQGWPAVVPAWAMAGGLLATLAIGALAGLYPAVRASRLPPTEALSGACSQAGTSKVWMPDRVVPVPIRSCSMILLNTNGGPRAAARAAARGGS
ncbi:ABC transporter permease, partial [Streptomyces sp. NPDC000188]